MLKIIAVVLFLGMAAFGVSVAQRLADLPRHQAQVERDLAALRATASGIAWEADAETLTGALASPAMQELRAADPARHAEAERGVAQLLESLGYQSRGRWTALRSGALALLLAAGGVWAWRRSGRATSRDVSLAS